MASLSDILQKYQETISRVLGNSFILGGEAEKGQVRDIISGVVEMVVEAKSNRGFSELLSSEANACVL